MKIDEPRDGRLHEAHSLADCVSNAAAATVLTVSVCDGRSAPSVFQNLNLRSRALE
jgi:hypothetical protein